MSEFEAVHGEVGEASRLKETDPDHQGIPGLHRSLPFAALSTVNRVPFA
jgi:hypothetical protein